MWRSIKLNVRINLNVTSGNCAYNALILWHLTGLLLYPFFLLLLFFYISVFVHFLVEKCVQVYNKDKIDKS